MARARARRTRVAVEEINPEPLEIKPDSKAELERLEGVFKQGHREAIAALREIRERKLYRHRNYGDFDSYMDKHWHRTRQWATQEINWLRVCELCEEKTGKEIYHYKRDWIRPLTKLLNRPDDLVLALQELVRENPQGKDAGEQVKVIVQRRMKFVKASDDWTYHCRYRRENEPMLQFKEFLVLEQLDTNRRGGVMYFAAAKAREQERPIKECLLEECAARQQLPRDCDLLEHFRCEQLEEVVLDLLALQMTWDYQSTIKEAQEEVKATLIKFRPAPEPEPEPAFSPARIIQTKFDEPDDADEEAMTAIADVVRKLWHGERSNYLQCDERDKRDHLYVKLCRIRNWLEGVKKSADEWAAA
jgi:hypothetical protein